MSQLVKFKFPQYIFGTSFFLNSVHVVKLKATLQPLLMGNFVSKAMAGKIARSGLDYSHLKAAFDGNGFDALSAVLGEKVDGIVHLTKHGPTVQKIFNYFSKL